MEKIINQLRSLGITECENVVNKLNLYLEKLYEWNETTNLTSCSREEFIEKHIIFSLNYIEFIREYTNIFDFGSGNGIPGLVLSFLFPDKRFFLIENRKRKIAFLEYISSVLSNNVEIIDSSVEPPPYEHLENFCVITKAFNDIKTMKKFFKKSFYLVIPTKTLEYGNVKVIGIYPPRIGEFKDIKFFILYVD